MRRFINKLFVMLYLPFLFLVTSCAPTLVDRVRALQEAYNSHNVEKELSFLTEDVRFEADDGYRWVMNGKQQWRKNLEWEATLNGHIMFTDLKVSVVTVTCKLRQQDDWFKAAGIDALYYEYVQFIFKNGLIKEVRAKYAQDTAGALKEFDASFGKWASEKRSQELAELAPEGELAKENVSKLLTLVREWREETEKEKQ